MKKQDKETKNEIVGQVLEMPQKKEPVRNESETPKKRDLSPAEKEKMKTAALERKKKMVDDPNSIFYFPFNRRISYDIKKSLINIDRSYRFLRRDARTPDTIDTAMKMSKKLADTSKKVWDIVTSVIPKLHSVTAESFREVNNDISEKRVMATKPASIGISVSYPEVQLLAMSVKQIETRGKILQDTNLEELPRLMEAYDKMSTEIGNIGKQLQDALKNADSGKRMAAAQ